MTPQDTMTLDEAEALEVAGQLIDAGIPVFAARPALDAAGEWDPTGGTGNCGYYLPKQWEKTTPTRNWLDPGVPGFEKTAWRPGWALCAVMGHGLDLLDVDPRNGGTATRAALQAAGLWPTAYGVASTPSEGTHEFIASLHVGSRDGVRDGLDIKGGLPDGRSRGFAFIAPTVKASKTTGELVAYRWTRKPDLDALTDGDDDSGRGIADLVRQVKPYNGGTSAGPGLAADFLTVKEWPHDKPIDDGKRHDQLVSYAGSLLKRSVRLDEAEVLMQHRWKQCPQPPQAKSPLPLHEAMDKLHDVYRRYSPGTVPADLDALEEVADRAGRPETPSWAPMDLSDVLDGSYVQLEPTLFRRTDGQALLYPGLTHSLHGESESGKSLLMQVEAVRLINAGLDVLYIDFESDRESVARRLLTFGADREAIRAHFTYMRPEVQPRSSAAELAEWQAMLARGYTLAVIDGVTDCLGVFGFSTKDNDELVAWHRAVPRTIADRTGAAVALIDHVTKDNDTRGRFALGGQAKMNALTGAAYTVEIKEPLGRDLRGVVVLRVAKDRPGGIRAHCGPARADRTQEAARVVVDSRGGVPVVTVEPPGATSPVTAGESGPFRPTALMERVSNVLTSEPGLSKSAIATRVGKSKAHVLTAVDVLVAEGFVSVEKAARNGQSHTLVKPYRQCDDPASDRYEGRRTTQSPERPVSGSSPYTGELGTTTRPVLGTTAEPLRTAVPVPPEAAESATCDICSEPMTVVTIGQRTHPTCTPEDREQREAS